MERCKKSNRRGECQQNRFFGSIAQFERQLIVERINLGLDRAKKQDKSLGRPKGKKDTKNRRKSGYYQRLAKK
ncbi:hypothetical protein AYK25_03265 [Thermoplasmatales archaeon SM1-50]|nr:MAG: hypothetical protein AYK25_03265 [Thermoplasmatales archaeon SM1-50]